jgi:hypothetical protein
MSTGVVLLVVYAGIILGMAIYSYSIARNAASMYQQTADPRKDLMVTQTAEGIVCQVPYGTVRLAGNILYYGNLTSATHYEQSGGGKGGGSSSYESGYDYWLNVWLGICMGPITILATYVGDDKNKTISATQTTFNDGTTSDYPDWVTAEKVTGSLTTTSGDGPNTFTYHTGYTSIIPGTFSFAYVAGGLSDDGNGGILNTAGFAMTGCSFDYSTGDLVLTFDAVSGTFTAYRGSDPNAPFGASALPGLAHIAWEQWSLGTNTYNIPNVTFVVKRTLPTTIDYANMTNGANPAAVIYDIMTNTTYGIGMNPDDINITAFNAAAAVWNTKGYGLNFVLNQQNEAQALIEQVLEWVGGSFFIDNDGKFCIYAYSDSDTAVTTLDEDDFIDFNIERQSYLTTYNDLRIKYTDANCDYVSKTIGMFNNANFQEQNVPNQATIDLSCFSDVTTVSKRAWELLKTMSYPILRLKFKLNETKSYPIFAGSIVTINHSDYAIANANFRITNMSIGDDNAIEVEYSAEQVVEDIFDSEYGVIKPQTDGWITPDYSPVKLDHSQIYEMPWNPRTQDDPYYAFLGARSAYETSCENLKSIVNGTTNFDTIPSYQSFSQYGTLDAIYPATTYAIDDETGIIYTPYRNDPDPVDIRRANLFQMKRLILIDDELMVFQFQLPYGAGTQFQLLGVIRGVLGTTIAAHAIGAALWIFDPERCILPLADATPFWIKMLPSNNNGTVDSSTVTAIAVTPAQKAATPLAPYLMEATRSAGDSITVTWYPHVRKYTGAGMAAETISTDAWPFDFDGDFEYKIDSGAETVIAACTLTFTQAGSLTFYVRHKINGVYSAWTSLTIGAAAGHYLSEIGLVTY